MLKVLFIDDDLQAHKTLNLILPPDFKLISASTANEGLRLYRQQKVDVILLDIELPDKSGFEVLDLLNEDPLAPPVVILSARDDISSVVKAVRRGACDYLVKPYELNALIRTLQQAVQEASRPKEVPAQAAEEALAEMVGESEAMLALKAMVKRYASHSASVLITGPSGSGKELVAQALHRLSARRQGPFIALNCAAIPLSLFESELFGSEKGAFTDARLRPGSFELASGGSLFLDEIGEMSLEAQAKLLRVLETKELIRVGGTQTIRVDVRIISATNQDLRKLIAEKRFREDLFYRLSVLPLSLPPLAERKEDIILLALHFLRQKSATQLKLAECARNKLLTHAWPGNIRELRNVMERAIVLAEEGVVRARDIVF